jgi:hypothetical protein
MTHLLAHNLRSMDKLKQRKHLPLRVRLWIEFLKHNYSQSDFWKAS